MFGVRRMRGRRLGTALCALGYALALLCLILSATLHVGGDWKLYHRLQRRAGILGEAGVSEGDLLRLDEWLADYLGRNAKPQIEIDVFGARQAAFNDREMAHLADCAALFALARSVRAWAAAGAIALIAAGALRLRRAGWIARGMWLGGALLLLPLGSFALWAAADFGAAFTFFHERLFTNDLWLLDPATDLLIRICPSSMFAGMGLRIAVASLLGGIAPPLILSLTGRTRKVRRGK